MITFYLVFMAITHLWGQNQHIVQELQILQRLVFLERAAGVVYITIHVLLIAIPLIYETLKLSLKAKIGSKNYVVNLSHFFAFYFGSGAMEKLA